MSGWNLDSEWPLIGPRNTDFVKRKRGDDNPEETESEDPGPILQRKKKVALPKPERILDFVIRRKGAGMIETEQEIQQLTLKEFGDQLKNRFSWIALRFGLVLRARCERFRRIFYTEWKRARDDLETIERESRKTEPGKETENDINEDIKNQRILTKEKCLKMIVEVSTTLNLLKPSKDVMTKLKKLDTPWGFDELRVNLVNQIEKINSFTGLESIKLQISKLLIVMLLTEPVVMPRDRKESGGFPADTPLNRRRELADSLRSIKAKVVETTDPTPMIPDEDKTEKPTDRQQLQFLNFLLLGNPGTGKTLLANALTELMGTSGLLPDRTSKQFYDATRGDIVGRVSGQTAIKTKTTLLRSLGTALFFDELYTLVADADDAFGIECIDTIIPFLTQFKGLTSFIGAGYEDQIEKRIFAANPGFKSRFTENYRLRNYTAAELFSIVVDAVDQALRKPGREYAYNFVPVARQALRQIIADVWAPPYSFFEKSNARGVNDLFEKIKAAQSIRTLREILDKQKLQSPSRIIILNDVIEGFKDWVGSLGGFEVVVQGEEDSTQSEIMEEEPEE